MVEAATFRQDLFFRINAYPIELPSLRERPEDLPLLCEALLEGTAKRLTPEALALLGQHDFPGNVRELRNILERAVLLSDDESIRPEHLPFSLGPQMADPRSAQAARGAHARPWPDDVVPLDEAVAAYLRWAEARHDGDRASLATRLGISERTLYRRLRETATADENGSGS